jgi:prephenate dehydrogenase
MKKAVAVVGGGGRLGSWFVRFFTDQGYTVTVVEVGDNRTKKDIAMHHSIIVCATPHRIAPDIIRNWSEVTGDEHLIVDLSSVKTHTASACVGQKFEFLLLHPMWSPQVPTMKGQTLIVCSEGGVGVKSQELLKLFEIAGARLCYTTPDEHDKMMSMIQVVSHGALLAIGLTHQWSGLSSEKLSQSESPVYRMMSAMLGRMLSHQPELYADIATINPYGGEGLKSLRKAVEVIEEMVTRGDSDGYARLFAGVQSHRESEISHAVEDSALMIAALVDRALF